MLQRKDPLASCRRKGPPRARPGPPIDRPPRPTQWSERAGLLIKVPSRTCSCSGPDMSNPDDDTDITSGPRDGAQMETTSPPDARHGDQQSHLEDEGSPTPTSRSSPRQHKKVLEIRIREMKYGSVQPNSKSPASTEAASASTAAVTARMVAALLCVKLNRDRI